MRHGINYYRTSETLQYSSGVCEIYAVKLPFYLFRLDLFNSMATKLKLLILKERTEADIIRDVYDTKIAGNNAIRIGDAIKSSNMEIREKYNIYPSIISCGLNEMSFGKIFGTNGEEIGDSIEGYKTRLEQLDTQINGISESQKGKKLRYSVNRTFDEIFLADLQFSKDVLIKLNDEQCDKHSFRLGHMYFEALRFKQQLLQQQQNVVTATVGNIDMVPWQGQ